jgi:hypothetical protein
MHDVPSEPLINWEVRARDEQEKQIIAPSDTVDVDQLAGAVRIERASRAQATDREMLNQRGLLD